MSTGSTDRHGESIDPKGWKKSLKEFKKRSILLSSHNYGSLQSQIGELNDLQIAEEGLLAKPKYYINQGNSEADWAYFLASKGMAAFSVGFIPVKWVDSDGKDGEPSRTYLEQELLEISQVTVPSNRDAIMGLQAKGIDDPIIKEVIDEVLEDKDFFMAEDDKIANDDPRLLVPINVTKEMIKEGLKGIEPDPIDVEKLKAGIEKGEEELQNVYMEYKEDALNVYVIYEIVKENKELKEKLADFELKAGAVLNAQNKSNLKKAQELVQSVLDSAGTEEEGLEEGDDETKDTKKDDTVITITDTKKEDAGKDEVKDEKTITIDPEILKEAIAKALNYHLGIIKR